MKINFLGDSITEGALAGHIEKRYATLVANALGAEECNFGVSGTRIAKQVRRTVNPDDDVYMCRAVKMPQDANFTFVFGGTNDSWSNAPLGEMKFADWEEKDLFFVLPAICYFAYRLKTDLPKAEIVFIINTEIKEEIQNCMEELAIRYGIKAVRLQDISKDEGHPNKEGMEQICQQVLAVL